MTMIARLMKLLAAKRLFDMFRSRRRRGRY
jgi:hypothetical protein